MPFGALKYMKPETLGKPSKYGFCQFKQHDEHGQQIKTKDAEQLGLKPSDSYKLYDVRIDPLKEEMNLWFGKCPYNKSAITIYTCNHYV